MNIHEETSQEFAGFGELDLWFARMMTELDDKGGKNLFLAAALASRCTRIGHVCCDLSSAEAMAALDNDRIRFPKADSWVKTLSASRVVGKPGDYTPLILDDAGRLYLHRYWTYQKRIAGFVRSRATVSMEFDKELLGRGLSRLFPGHSETEEPDMQKVAAVSAVTRGFCVISGGPGTGKTYTAARILALIAEQAHARGDKARIFLAAPTGKAAARLGDAVANAYGTANEAPEVLAMIPERAYTIHRLLGGRPGGGLPHYNRENRLEADVVLVDEASMVDIALMSKLVDALLDSCRLILVGDRDQLVSVEAGSVFADICMAAGHGFSGAFLSLLENLGVISGQSKSLPAAVNDPMLADSVVYLERHYRFEEKSRIGHVSHLVSSGEGGQAVTVLQQEGCLDAALPDRIDADSWEKRVGNPIAEWVKEYMAAADDIGKVFERFDTFRVLCALRDGPYGAVAINRFAEWFLEREEVVQSGRTWYAGRPVMILKNDYRMELFNGDMGVTLEDSEGRLKVFFRDVGGGFRSFSPESLPEHETVYAMTVHKSQGSEFDRVLFVTPDRDSPVLTRELIYTAITRAKNSIEIIGEKDILELAVSSRPAARASGLSDEIKHGAKHGRKDEDSHSK